MFSQQQINNPLTLQDIIEEGEKQQQTCQQCNKFFKKISHFNRHMRQRHTQLREYRCTQEGCEKSFKRGSHLKRHMISHTNQKNYKCPNCIMSFGYKHHLDRHIKLIHLCELMQCKICNEQFKKRKSYNKHMKNHEKKTKKKVNIKDNNTNTKFSIDQSEKYYYSDQSKQINEVEKQYPQLYRCLQDQCISAFFKKHQLIRHLTSVHQKGVQQ